MFMKKLRSHFDSLYFVKQKKFTYLFHNICLFLLESPLNLFLNFIMIKLLIQSLILFCKGWEIHDDIFQIFVIFSHITNPLFVSFV